MRHALLLGLLAACGGDVPSNPTYFADVQPILRANCARCHGADPAEMKLAKFRLDRYVKGDEATFDAYDYAVAAAGDRAPMLRLAVDLESPAMPPDYELTDRQKDILERWADQGAPKGTRANRDPQIALTSDAPTTADQSVDVAFRAWDDDLDGLVVRLWAHDIASSSSDQDLPVGEPTGGGSRAFAVDTGQLASKHTFSIYAVIDDGFDDDPTKNRHVATLVPALVVDHGARGTAPTVKLTAPNGGETLIGTADITWAASDPDVGDTLSIDLALMSVAADGSETVAATIASGQANTGTYTWTIPANISDAGTYRVRVTATDAGAKNTRSDESDGTVSIGKVTTTTYTWADVKPIFLTYCMPCHGQPARTQALEYFRLDKYDAADTEAPANSDLGVYEMRNTVYTRMITQANMPPAAAPKPSQADRDKVANWILGGAPKGGGPANARPTFMWVQPSATQASGTTVMLAWKAADTEGLASGKLEYATVNGNAAQGCTATTTMSATWTAVPDPKASATLAGALTWMDSFTWTLTNAGVKYFCFRGVVTDQAGQSTTVVNPYGVK